VVVRAVVAHPRICHTEVAVLAGTMVLVKVVAAVALKVAEVEAAMLLIPGM
jgi:hypothetical protein